MIEKQSVVFNLHCFKVFEPISNKSIKTFTVDRDKEFADYNEIEKRLNIDNLSYYMNPNY